jgi:hypothetical protein
MYQDWPKRKQQAQQAKQQQKRAPKRKTPGLIK